MSPPPGLSRWLPSTMRNRREHAEHLAEGCPPCFPLLLHGKKLAWRLSGPRWDAVVEARADVRPSNKPNHWDTVPPTGSSIFRLNLIGGGTEVSKRWPAAGCWWRLPSWPCLELPLTAELTADETVSINTIVHELAGTSELGRVVMSLLWRATRRLRSRTIQRPHPR